MVELVTTHRKYLHEQMVLLVAQYSSQSTILKLVPLDSGWKVMITQEMSYEFTLKASMGSQSARSTTPPTGAEWRAGNNIFTN